MHPRPSFGHDGGFPMVYGSFGVARKYLDACSNHSAKVSLHLQHQPCTAHPLFSLTSATPCPEFGAVVAPQVATDDGGHYLPTFTPASISKILRLLCPKVPAPSDHGYVRITLFVRFLVDDRAWIIGASVIVIWRSGRP